MKFFLPLTFNKDTFKIILDGLEIYKNALNDNLEIEKTFNLEEKPIEKEIGLLEKVIQKCREKYKKAEIDLEITYDEELIKLFKLAILLNLDETEEKKRLYLTKNRNIPKPLLDAIDQKIVFMNDKLNLPAFQRAEARKALINKKEPLRTNAIIQEKKKGLEIIEETKEKSSHVIERTKESIYILDQVLAERVKDLLEKGKDGLYDRPIREVATVIEDRLRSKTGLGKDTEGTKLISKALNAKTGIFIISEDIKEQEGIQLIFQGFFKFIRNFNSHNLDEQQIRERAIQIVGFGDYLLSLLDGARLRGKNNDEN